MLWRLLPLMGFLSLIYVSCGPEGNRTEKERADSIRKADSLRIVEEARRAVWEARQDSILKDSLLRTDIEKQYTEGLKLVMGKKTKQSIGSSEMPYIEWPLTLKNNTIITVTPADYEISYVAFMEEEGDNLQKWTETRAFTGPEMLPGGSGDAILISDGEAMDVDMVRVAFKITKEAFTKRYREAKRAAEPEETL